MPAELLIAPLEKTDWRLDFETFKAELAKKWINIEFEIDTNPELFGLNKIAVPVLCFEFENFLEGEDEYIEGLFDGIQLSLGHRSTLTNVEILFWYRQIVPPEIKLYFWWNDDIKNRQELKLETTTEELSKYM
jgi:hypothetical protein